MLTPFPVRVPRTWFLSTEHLDLRLGVPTGRSPAALSGA